MRLFSVKIESPSQDPRSWGFRENHPKNSFHTASINMTGIDFKSYRAVRMKVFAEAFPCTGLFACFSISHPFQSKCCPCSNPWRVGMLFPPCQAALLHPSAGCVSAPLQVWLGDRHGWETCCKLVISPWSCLFIDHLQLFPPSPPFPFPFFQQGEWQPVPLRRPMPPHPILSSPSLHRAQSLPLNLSPSSASSFQERTHLLLVEG